MLNRYGKNFFSQNGEDGIIIELLKRLNFEIKSHGVVNLVPGMVYGSNTFNLVKYNFNAVYIESNKSRFKDLLKTQKVFKNYCYKFLC